MAMILFVKAAFTHRLDHLLKSDYLLLPTNKRVPVATALNTLLLERPNKAMRVRIARALKGNRVRASEHLRNLDEMLDMPDYMKMLLFWKHHAEVRACTVDLARLNARMLLEENSPSLRKLNLGCDDPRVG
ncbi:hypothetical protein [Oleiharenicola lentus]|uniref:hypothetical protein n=1 Tax=Oleiharenicola lentus TaxID=2508720 RepID=UPI003F6679A2